MKPVIVATALICLAGIVGLPGPAYSQSQAGQARPPRIVLQPQPSPSFLSPTPQAMGSTAPGPVYTPAPTPNRDELPPSGPRASTAPTVGPGLFTRGQQYRGEGYSEGSTAQAEQEKRARPGAGFRLRMPLAPN